MNDTRCNGCLFYDECLFRSESCDHYAPVDDGENEYIEQSREAYRSAWQVYVREDEYPRGSAERITEAWSRSL